MVGSGQDDAAGAGALLPEAPGGAARIIPPVWFLLACIAMPAIDWYFVTPRSIAAPYAYAGFVIGAAGLGLAYWGKRQFDRAGTPVRPFTKSTAVVETGPFRWTRNPMYLGMVIVLTGIGVYLGTWPPLILVPAFAWFINGHFIVHEERIMEQLFGAAYIDYKSRVRRWL